MKGTFNIIINGVGGQGIITMIQVIAQAAFLEGQDVRASELHGLSQRGGSVLAHVRFGKEVFSPLVARGKVDLVLSLEMTEALRVLNFSNSQTFFIINKKFIPFFEGPTEKEVNEDLKEIPARVHLIDASRICLEETGKEVLSGIYLLSLACHKGFLPLKPQSILRAIEKIIPSPYLSLNKEIFELAKEKAS